MNYAEKCQIRGIKLELSYHKARKCWRKKFKGKVFYFSHPITQEGYSNALLEWSKTKAKLNNERENIEVWIKYKDFCQQIVNFYNQFGLPKSEIRIANEVTSLIEYIDETLESPNLPEVIPFDEFEIRPSLLKSVGKYKTTNRDNQIITEDKQAIIGTMIWSPAPFWQDRVSRLTTKVLQKEPQTIGHWLQKFLDRAKNRSGLSRRTVSQFPHKLRFLKENMNLNDHVSSVDSGFLDNFEAAINKAELARETKKDYFSAAKQFIKWASSQESCEMKLPLNFHSREKRFREEAGIGRSRLEKKKDLWTPEEFKKVIDSIPTQQAACLMLFLNCGFRHADVSELKKTDVDLKAKRITIQRNKLNQMSSAPTISYLLWSKSVQLLKKAMSEDSEFVFQNQRGGQIEDSLKTWWKREKHKYGNKRLDYLRKTGSTIVAKFDANLDSMYLGEALKETAKKNYSFVDGEVNESLDRAIQFLGSEFGFCEAPAKQIELTPDMIEALQKAGFQL